MVAKNGSLLDLEAVNSKRVGKRSVHSMGSCCIVSLWKH